MFLQGNCKVSFKILVVLLRYVAQSGRTQELRTNTK
jgi:hypothetical protein